MTSARARFTSTIASGVSLLVVATSAWAQDGAPAPLPPPPAQPFALPLTPKGNEPTVAPAVPEAPVEPTQPPTEPVAPAVAPPAPPAAPAVSPPPAPAPLPPAEIAPPVPAQSAWYDSFAFAAFADVYGAVDFNFPKGPGQSLQNSLRAFDNHQGFSLNWVGLDVSKAAEPVGGVVQLRFGPGAARLASACVDADTCDSDSNLGLANVKQAFASWRPGGKGGIASIDFGKFDTPYGAEVADSQYNINYTRGVLYWLGQPAYHTGLRLGLDPLRELNIKLLAVNGWNRSVDNNAGKSFGVQGTLRVPKRANSEDDLLSVALGYLVGPEHSDSCYGFNSTGCRASTQNIVDLGSSNTKGLRHFLDLTAVALPSDALKLLFNASLGFDRTRYVEDPTKFQQFKWYGFAVGARYALSEKAGVAGRAEYYADPDGYTAGLPNTTLEFATGTLTFDYSPARELKLFFDGRLDWANKTFFAQGTTPRDTGYAPSATLGAIISTN